MNTRTSKLFQLYYKYALDQFLRKGIHVDIEAFEAAFERLNLKSESELPYYVWRTAGDSKVRASHAANNGRIFSWDNPPPTGHPGEEFGCRCTAEDYDGVSSYLYRNTIAPIQNYIQDALKATPQWNNLDMSLHFYTGSGHGVTLSQIGHLEKIKSFYETNYLNRFETQIMLKADGLKDGPFTEKFYTVYDFQDALYSYRMANMTGKFEGEITTLASGQRIISGTSKFQFIDWFSDPIDMRQGSLKLVNYFSETPFNDKDIPQFLHTISEVGGHPFPIIDSWNRVMALDIQN